MVERLTYKERLMIKIRNLKIGESGNILSYSHPMRAIIRDYSEQLTITDMGRIVGEGKEHVFHVTKIAEIK